MLSGKQRGRHLYRFPGNTEKGNGRPYHKLKQQLPGPTRGRGDVWTGGRTLQDEGSPTKMHGLPVPCRDPILGFS